MELKTLNRHFARMGARIAGQPVKRKTRIRSTNAAAFTLDVEHDRFLLNSRPGVSLDLDVLDVQPRMRHLLLMVRNLTAGEKQKFLCGHDERAWFVAAIPEKSNASTVRNAMEALKPGIVRDEQERRRVPHRARIRRRTLAYRRQGEWFFVPCPDLTFPDGIALRNEPLTRGAGSKPHRAQYCVRQNGVTVYVSRAYPRGITQPRYDDLLKRDPSARLQGWRVMRRDMDVYVRGRISHSDHKTIDLPCWHKVEMNTENQSKAMQFVAFLD